MVTTMMGQAARGVSPRRFFGPAFGTLLAFLPFLESSLLGLNQPIRCFGGPPTRRFEGFEIIISVVSRTLGGVVMQDWYESTDLGIAGQDCGRLRSRPAPRLSGGGLLSPRFVRRIERPTGPLQRPAGLFDHAGSVRFGRPVISTARRGVGAVGWLWVVMIWMVRFLFALALAGALGLGMATLVGGCATGWDSHWNLDLDPPRLVALSGLSVGGPGDLLVLSPLDPLQAQFTEPLDPAFVDQDHIVLVEGIVGSDCHDDAHCPPQVQGAASFCVDEVCQASPVGQAFCRDLDSLPLTESRWKQVVPAVIQAGPDVTVTITPLAPLAPNRLYSLAIGPVQDLGGNPIQAAFHIRAFLGPCQDFAVLVHDQGQDFGSAQINTDGQVRHERPSCFFICFFAVR